VVGDKGLWGRGYQARLAAGGIELLTPAIASSTQIMTSRSSPS
jgi:hypothetical protein